MREIVFDTETTGLDPSKGDRIVEIGAVELINHVPTGVTFHKYINPECSIREEVIAVHGLTEEFLSDKPKFNEIADEFLEFIGEDSFLVAHNASFDMKFINAELSLCGIKPLSNDRVIDTLILARKRFPGSKVNLDVLCKKFNIDNSIRTKHGALLDSELLAEVYLELLGGREPGLSLDNKKSVEKKEKYQFSEEKKDCPNEYKEPRLFDPTPEELEQHFEFVKKIKNNLWGFD